MLRRVLCLLLCACLSAAGWAEAPTPPKATDPEVLKGISQAEDGDYDAAIMTLEAASKRLTGDPSHLADLSQAYLYMGVAYLGKGHEAAARAKFREALKQERGLTLSTDEFPPKVIDSFEAAREDMAREATVNPSPSPAPSAGAAAPESGGGGGKTLWIVGGVALAAGGLLLATKGGSTPSPAPTITTDVYPNEVVPFGGEKDYAVTVRAPGPLTASVTWNKDGVVLGLYLFNLAHPSEVLVQGTQTGAKETTLADNVPAGSYKVAVTNNSGTGPHGNTTFTLTITHP
jgi:hypothetical protein